MSSSNHRVFFRTDASNVIGLGHLTRCLAMAEMLTSEFECVFIINHPDIYVANMVNVDYQLISLHCVNPAQEIQFIKKIVNNLDIFVADGYQFNEDYQKSIKQLVKKLVMIDDKADSFFYADVIFNHGDISLLPPYKTKRGTEIFSGLDYIIVRQPFLERKVNKAINKSIKTVFICMGGADPFNVTIKAVNAAAKCSFVKKIVVITGKSYQNFNELNIICSNLPIDVQHINNASTHQLINSINECDLCMTTSSSIAIEVCCVRSPLICGTVIDNQYAIHELLSKSGLCYSIGDWKTIEEGDIQTAIGFFRHQDAVDNMISNQQLSIDGKSPGRILSVFKRLAS